jgi:hypothetical protein
LKKFDISTIPPFYDVLVQQINRVNLICSMWKNATINNPFVYNPEEDGWKINRNEYSINLIALRRRRRFVVNQ